MKMFIILILVIAGFLAGYFLDIPVYLLGTKYLALLFLAIIDSFTYGLSRDISGQKNNNVPVIVRLTLGLLVSGFIIYFGEKSQLDLYLIALMPLAIGFAINMYKFLPK